jgi:hypothetical protein
MLNIFCKFYFVAGGIRFGLPLLHFFIIQDSDLLFYSFGFELVAYISRAQLKRSCHELRYCDRLGSQCQALHM